MADLHRKIPINSSYITISMPMNRITVRDAILESLGNPQFLSFMMQDDGKAAILRPAKAEDDNAISVPEDRPHRKFQFGGKVLVGLIRDSMGWNQNVSYRVTAEPINENMLLFDFTKAVKSISSKTKGQPEKEQEEVLNADPEDENTDYYWKDNGAPVIKPTDENGEIIVDVEEYEETDSKAEMIEEDADYSNFDFDETVRASEKMTEWGWSRERIDAWKEEMHVNVQAASRNFIKWKNGEISQEEFFIQHKELEHMDYAFELGRRVSIVRRIRANIKAFNPTMMAILYDERAEVCNEILTLVKRNQQISDFEVVDKVKW